MEIQDLLINWTEAQALVASIDDPIEKKLLGCALGTIIVPLIKHDKLSEEEYQKHLPHAPFDALYHIQAVRRLLRDRDELKRLFDGDVNAMEW
jgi:hypothetical protein